MNKRSSGLSNKFTTSFVVPVKTARGGRAPHCTEKSPGKRLYENLADNLCHQKQAGIRVLHDVLHRYLHFVPWKENFWQLSLVKNIVRFANGAGEQWAPQGCLASRIFNNR